MKGGAGTGGTPQARRFWIRRACAVTCTPGGMKRNATEVRRRLFSLLDELSGDGIVITRHGKALARLVPIREARKGRYVTGPMVPSKGRPGPLCPTTENPYDLLFD
jgi:prevent-host-death family protein